MKTVLKDWLKKLAAPFWAALYLVIFRGFGALIFVTLSFAWGVWYSALTMTMLFGLWGTSFYIVLVNTESFDQLKDVVGRFLEKRKNKLFSWIRKKFFTSEQVSISPALILFVFIAESPLTGVPIIRLGYPKEKFWKGLMWIWIGAVAEVATWFLPIYGGGFTLIKSFWIWLTTLA